MSVERVSSRSPLLVRRDGSFMPTEKGKIAHSLWRIELTLHKNTGGWFAMSPEYREKLMLTREELCDARGLPKDEKIRTRVIHRDGKRLEERGFPISRINI